LSGAGRRRRALTEAPAQASSCHTGQPSRSTSGWRASLSASSFLCTRRVVIESSCTRCRRHAGPIARRTRGNGRRRHGGSARAPRGTRITRHGRADDKSPTWSPRCPAGGCSSSGACEGWRSEPPPIDAPCTQWLRHGNPMSVQKQLTAAVTAGPLLPPPLAWRSPELPPPSPCAMTAYWVAVHAPLEAQRPNPREERRRNDSPCGRRGQPGR
jgi:hypothetical protein